jgi:MFS family permease
VAASKSKEANTIHDLEISRASSTDTLLSHNNSVDYGTVSARRLPSSSSSVSSPDSRKNSGGLNSEDTTLSSVLKSQEMQFIIINYLFLTFTEMASSVLMPLVYSTEIKLGGLGLDPYHIGMIMGIRGFFNAFVQIGLLGKLIRKYGACRVYQASYASFCICLLTYPVSTYLARRNGGISVGVGISIFVQLLFQPSLYMGYGVYLCPFAPSDRQAELSYLPGAIQVIVAENSPKSILGSINGIVQMVGCIMRTIAPIISSSLFSISLQEHLLGGNFVYVVLFAVIMAGFRSSLSLPVFEKRAAL